MGILVFVLLIAAWGYVLYPLVVQDGKPSAKVSSTMKKFESFFSTAKRKRPLTGRLILAPRKPLEPARVVGQPRGAVSTNVLSAADRRRQTMTYLAGFIVVTFLLGMLPPMRFFLWACLIASVLFVAYVAAAAYFSARKPVDSQHGSPRVSEVPTIRVAEGGR